MFPSRTLDVESALNAKMVQRYSICQEVRILCPIRLYVADSSVRGLYPMYTVIWNNWIQATYRLIGQRILLRTPHSVGCGLHIEYSRKEHRTDSM